MYQIVVKSFRCVDIHTESQNISILVNIEGGNIVYEIDGIQDTENSFVLAYPQPLTGSQIYQNKT